MTIPLKVAIYKGSDLIGEQRFDRDIIKIGRLASAHLRLDDAKVSRIHAVIEVSSDGQGFSIIDMGSSDGTFVNGERVSKEKLRDGDEIRVGDCRLVIAVGEDGDLVQPGQVVEVRAARSTDMVAHALPGASPDPAVHVATQQHAAWMPGQIATEPRASIENGASLVSNAPAAVAWAGAMGMSPQPQLPEMNPAMLAAIAAQRGGMASLSPPIGMNNAPPSSYAVTAPPAASGALSASPFQPGMAPRSWPPVNAPVPIPYDPNPSQIAGDLAGGPPPAPQKADAWGTVPNNLASQNVPENERALEIKVIWGVSVLDTINVTDKPVVTLGDEPKTTGWGPFQTLVRCDIEAPSKGLPLQTFPLAVSQSREGASYLIRLHKSFGGYIEKVDGTITTIEDLFKKPNAQLERVSEGDLSDTWNYTLQPEETVYIYHGLLTLQVRYVRRAPFVPPPMLQNLNYTWINILILAFFFHVLAIASFMATPDAHDSLEDSIFKNPNKFAQFKLTQEKKQQQKNDLLAKLKAGAPAAKAAKSEGKAGRKDFKEKNQGRMAVKGDPNDKEIAKSTLAKLFGKGNTGRSFLFGQGGLGGELKGALGGVTGAQIGDASGLAGLGTRGAGPGGGGLSMNSVGLGALGTAGLGGGGDGSYGGIGNLGKKAERDITISGGSPIVMGSLDKELIRRVIDQHKAQIRYCYEKELVRSPGLFGKINMQWIITGDGTVSVARTKETTMNNAEVERCIASKIRTWIFPKPKGGGEVDVNYPFVFKTSG